MAKGKRKKKVITQIFFQLKWQINVKTFYFVLSFIFSSFCVPFLCTCTNSTHLAHHDEILLLWHLCRKKGGTTVNERSILGFKTFSLTHYCPFSPIILDPYCIPVLNYYFYFSALYTLDNFKKNEVNVRS